jgi:NADH:ubiquinone oxidoreductase subunit F (NADH-binding)/Pyruvate/2-oxoacid:ferredoxin oxidoreductase delta subunit
MKMNNESINIDLIKNYLFSKDNESGSEISEYFKRLRYDYISNPLIFISYYTNSIFSGVNKIIDAVNEYLANHNISIPIIKTGGLGIFSFEPIIQIQIPGKTRILFRNVNENNINLILDGVLNNYLHDIPYFAQIRNNELDPWDNIPFLDELSIFKFQKRLVLKNCGIINPYSIEEYIANGGFTAFKKVITRFTYNEICDIIEKSGLRGRGGAGFLTGKKWKIALSGSANQRYLICNADESDPGSYMERFIIEGDPYKLIEGIAIGAYAINSSHAYIYIRKKYNLALERLENAISECYKYGLLGENIFDSGFNLKISIVKGGGAFICGEETALIRSIEGKRAMPTPKPPYPAEKGLFSKPTVINNAETLYNIPDIINNGPGWFRSFGTEKSPGTKVISISGKINYNGVFEIQLGTSILSIIENLGGGLPDDCHLKAVHIGGPAGGCIPASDIETLFDYETLKEKYSMMGSAGIMVLDESICMVDLAKYFIGYIQEESCGKCIPCREGSRRMFEILENITRKPSDNSGIKTLERFKGVIYLENLAQVIKESSLCGLGQSAPNPVLSTLKWFKDEYEDHIFERKCRAGICKELRTFYIDTEKCIGCDVCAQKCPTAAILGTKKSPYFIISEKCNSCGICFDVCKFNAVIVS